MFLNSSEHQETVCLFFKMLKSIVSIETISAFHLNWFITWLIYWSDVIF